MFEYKGLKIHWLGHDGFKIKDGLTIYFDPFRIKQDEKADLIFITAQFSGSKKQIRYGNCRYNSGQVSQQHGRNGITGILYRHGAKIYGNHIKSGVA